MRPAPDHRLVAAGSDPDGPDQLVGAGTGVDGKRDADDLGTGVGVEVFGRVLPGRVGAGELVAGARLVAGADEGAEEGADVGARVVDDGAVDAGRDGVDRSDGVDDFVGSGRTRK